MKRLEVSGAVRPLYGSLGVKGLRTATCRTQLRRHPVWITQQASVVSLNNIKRMLSVIVPECVYCEVRTEYTCVTFTRSFLTGDPRSIPSHDMWDTSCKKWHWTAVSCFPPASVIPPMRDVNPRINTAAAIWWTEGRSLLAVKVMILRTAGRQGLLSSPLPSKMSAFW